MVESSYYLSLVHPADYQDLAKFLCVAVLGRPGRASAPLALCLKLLFLHGPYDLTTLLEVVFHFFAEWCTARTTTSAEHARGDRAGMHGGYAAGTQGVCGGMAVLSLDEPVMHIMATVNVLLAKCGAACGAQLRKHGDIDRILGNLNSEPLNAR